VYFSNADTDAYAYGNTDKYSDCYPHGNPYTAVPGVFYRTP
jgi:hypothetical protein